MALPSTYKQVEYIESNPTNPWDSTWTYQYINTWYNPTLNTEISIDIQLTNTANQSTLFWVTTSNTSYLSFISYVNGSNHWARYMRNWNSWSPTDTWVTVDTNRHTFVVNKSSYKIYTNWTQTYSWTNTNSPTTNWNIPLYLFANNGDWTPNIVSASKLYSCKIWNNWTLVRDFVPVIRKSDNKPWLYDLANNGFYTNSGTGEFKYPAQFWKITHIYLGTNLIRPKQSSMDFYYSDDNWSEYQSLVSSVWSVQFVDTWKRYRFNNPCYIWNRTIVNVNGSTFSKINVDTLTVISSKSSTLNGRIWYFWDNRILTRDGIIDFDWNMVTSFGTTYRAITPWLPWEVWANDNSYGMYKGIVNWDNITFTKVWTSTSNSWIWASPWLLTYWRLWVYQLWSTENSTHYVWFVNASTWTLSTIAVAAWQEHMAGDWECMPDWKIYKHALRTLWWWRLYKIWTSGEWAVWNQFGSSWTSYWTRFWKFLWNIVSWWMWTQNGTGNWYWSNNYFINSSWTLTLVQSNAFAYDTNIYSSSWCIDENWRIYPATSWWGSGVILKTDKALTDFHWWNPYLWR